MKFPMRLGFIGTGILGKEILKNILKAGYKPAVYNRTYEKAKEFEDLGCNVVSLPKTIGEISEAVILVLENDEALRSVLEGDNGLFRNFKQGNYIINMSTISIDFSRYLNNECFKRKIHFLDCPVSGSKKQAQEKELLIFASGKEKDINLFLNLFSQISKDVIYVGEVPNSTILKLSINIILAYLTIAITESIAFANLNKLNPKIIFDVLEKSPVLNCGFWKGKRANILNDDFTTSFSIKNMLKDIKYVIKEIQKNKLKLAGIERVFEIFEKAFNHGYYNEDITAIKKIYLDFFKNT